MTEKACLGPKFTLLLCLIMKKALAILALFFAVVGAQANVTEVSTRSMTSVYPVRVHVQAGSLCVKSKKAQQLPIYTNGGALYLSMQLTPGTNWLFGLPRGRYRINNRIVDVH